MDNFDFSHIKGEPIKPQKPPIGIMPEFVWIEKRKSELKAAIKRYLEANQHVPIEWIVELNKYCDESPKRSYVKGGFVVSRVIPDREFKSLRELQEYLDKLSDETLDKELLNDGYNDGLTLCESLDGKTILYK